MRKSFVLFSIFVICLTSIGCGSEPKANTNTAAEKVCDPVNDTPTEAYRRLFAAVKQKNTEQIKAEMSKKSQEFAEFLATRQKNTIEKVYENGFTATTFSPTLPEMRDERLSSCWAALEVRNNKDQIWEDLPFVNEDGKWKMAFAEQFNGIFKSPGKGMATKEKEAANVALGNQAPPQNIMANSNANVNTNVPKYDGPQVEPLPKKK